jgi:phosphate transport system substrate-binding protein
MAAVLGSGCAEAEELSGSLQIKGSDTMVNLCQAWAEAFMSKHPGVTVAVTGGGSGTGFASLISGTCDLAASSRQIKPKERSLAESKGASPSEETVALDGLAVVVHPDNPIRQLTIRQLADLFAGRVTNWKDLGGKDADVVLLSREVNSGTHVYFKEHVLDAGGSQDEFAPSALLLPSSQAIADEVTANPSAIGYYGMGYLNPKNVAVAVAKSAEANYVMPSEETVRSGDYPISRPLFLYTRMAPAGLVKAFLEFTQSPDGQKVVRATDFVPMADAAP